MLTSSSLPLKWHGGKQYLAPKIVELIPPHTHYVEAFFGGGAVLFAKPAGLVQGHSELINDLNGELTNFWYVLRDESLFQQFTRKVQAVPFSKQLWVECCQSLSNDAVERAIDFFVQYRQSRQGIGQDFATMSRSRTRRGMNEQVSAWLSAIDGLSEVHGRLKRVVICNEDALSVIRREDSAHTFFYLDPPYLPETRTALDCYENEMSNIDHQNLLSLISSLEGRFLLSGYPSQLYSAAAKANGWSRVDVSIDNKASGAKQKPIKTECFWMNY